MGSFTSSMKKEGGIIATSLLFLLGHLYLIWYDHYWFAFLPLLCFVILGAFFRPIQVLFLVVLATPLSLNIEKLGIGLGGAGVAIPTEPLLAGLMLLFVYKILLEGYPDKRVLKHPMSLLLLTYLGWTLISTITSTMFLVSFKHFLAQCWFVIGLYFLPLYFFQDRKWIHRFPWAYALPLSLVVLYTLIRHAAHGFAEEPSHFVMNPFYKDHTVYGAALALVTPLILERFFSKKLPLHLRGGLFLLCALLVLGIVFSYTRATWVSLLGMALLYPFLLLRIPFKIPLTIALIAAGGLYIYQDQLYMQLEQNKKASNENLADHVESISNVATDASNLERINRWKSAWRMFEEHPVFGFGPGTYQFKYAPYQEPEEKTIISTNFGTRGTAHSEFLGPLSESGAPGFLIRSGIVIYLFYMGFRLYFTLPKGRLRGTTTAVYLGLVTYFTHGVLNNFLDQDKAAVPVWLFIAIITAVDVYHKDKESEQKGLEVGSSGNSDPQ